MKRGSITIYMTLVLSVLLSLFLTVIEGARRNAVSMQAECAFDLAVYSVFAEYNREMAKQFDLLFIDTSYGESSGSIEKTKNHFDAYINENLSQGNTIKTGIYDLTKTFLENSEIENYSYATDENGAVFERQAIAYMKHKYGVAYLQKLQKELKAANENELFTKDITGQRSANQNVIDQTEIPAKDTGKKDQDGNPVMEEVELQNPADSVNKSRPKGILLLVADKDTEFSENTVDLDHCISHIGVQNAGVGLKDRDRISAADKLFFDAYIMDKCGTYIHPKQDGALQYQVEYILAGKNNDIDNLKAVVNRLLLMRECANVVYLFSDGAKVAEAEGVATAVATAAGVPVLIEPIKISILFAWAYAESVYDVKQLLADKRIPLIKTAENWHFSLEGMLHYETDDSIQAAASDQTDQIGDTILDGLSYEDYLRLLLTVKQEKEKTFAMMDIVELDVRKHSVNSSFSLNNCIDLMSVEACVGSRFGYYRIMQRKYYYI